MSSRIKREVLRLLEEDEEFRYAVAGAIGLGELLKRMDRFEKELVELKEELVRLRRDMNGMKRNMNGMRKEVVETKKDVGGIKSEVGALKADVGTLKGEVGAVKSDVGALKSDVGALKSDVGTIKGELGAVKSDVGALKSDVGTLKGEVGAVKSEVGALKGDVGTLKSDVGALKGEVRSLRNDMVRGFGGLSRKLTALGARWGLDSEEAFRRAMRGILGEELGLKVERWVGQDSEGVVYGQPSEVEIDVAVSDGRTVLVEVSSHVRRPDVFLFLKKAQFYERQTGRRPDRLIFVSPFVERQAARACREHGIEFYTKT